MRSDRDAGAALRVAVVTPYHREEEHLLAAAHASVVAQTHPCTHILVADGHPSPAVAGFAAQHIVLPVSHGDYGDTPRAVGSFSAVGQGFDAITYLDADNWYAVDHVESMIALSQRTGASVCVAARSLHRLDGSLLDAHGEPSDGATHVDTNCLFLTSAAFRVLPLWALVPRALHPIDDRIVWAAILALGLRVARWNAPTVHYRTAFRIHYEERGEAPPPGAKGHEHVRAAMAWWKGLSPHDREVVFQRLGVRF